MPDAGRLTVVSMEYGLAYVYVDRVLVGDQHFAGASPVLQGRDSPCPNVLQLST